MKVRLILAIVLIAVLPYWVGAENFVFKYKEGEKYRYLTQVNEKIYINEEYNNSAEILNRIAVRIEQVKDKKGYLFGTYQVSERLINDEAYITRDEDAISKYWVDEKGNFEGNKNSLYPLTRNIPYFSKSEIKQGSTWEAPADEIHDLRVYGYEQPIHIPIKVKYTFDGVEKVGDRQLAVIKTSYSVYRELPELMDLSTKHPVNILGKINQTFYWDMEDGRVVSHEEEFHVVYTMNTEQVVDFVGTSAGELVESPEMNKKKIEQEIKKSLDDQKIQDTTVTADESGVTITLEDIHFKAESDMLMPEEQDKLAKIGAILKKYPERDIFIAGHTAMAGTEEGRQTLSEKRAKAVADFLLMLGVRDEKRLTYKGFGAKFPVADNSTEQGMKKNRRVEIRILEN